LATNFVGGVLIIDIRLTEAIVDSS